MKEKKIKQLSTESELNFYLDQALKDKHTRIEYIRKGRGNQPRQKIGVMIACIDPTNPDMVLVGFSLCHQGFDKFDKLAKGMIDQKNFGKKLAHRRALKFRDCAEAVIYSDKIEENFSETVYIPATVHESLAKFVLDSYKYFKDKLFPVWVENYFPKPEEKGIEDETITGEAEEKAVDPS